MGTQKKAFVTGISGQDGAYLAKLLLEKGYDVYGGMRRSSGATLSRLATLGIKDKVKIADVELLEINSISRAFKEIRPDEIYNLAAQSFVGTSWAQPIVTSQINAMGTLRVLEAAREYVPEAKVYQASTSEMFGKIRENPQSETTPFYPRSPYGVSKVFGHWACVNYRESFGQFVCSGILFNHESPLRGEEFVTRKITLGLANYKRGLGGAIELGNMKSIRDWGFAGDYVEGMWRMMQHDTPDDYVIATGKTTSIRAFVDYAAEALDISIEWTGEGIDEMGLDKATGEPVVRTNPTFFRPAEVDILCGDATKARDILGWTPTVPVDQLAQMMAKSDFDLD